MRIRLRIKCGNAKNLVCELSSHPVTHWSKNLRDVYNILSLLLQSLKIARLRVQASEPESKYSSGLSHSKLGDLRHRLTIPVQISWWLETPDARIVIDIITIKNLL